MKGLAMASMLLLLQTPAADVLTINWGGQQVEKVERSEYGMTVAPFIDIDKLEQLTEKLEHSIYVKPQNASIGDRGEIVPERNGSKLNRTKLAELIETFFYEGQPGSIEAPLTAIYPRVDSELLSFVREKPIGSYVTYYNARNRNRSHNIMLAAKAINNRVVFQGERFSFNETVGVRTQQNGYERAPVIVKGEMSEGIGGGICQVSSTLYNAIDRAGLRVVHRYSHSRHVPYVPPGRDATVSWGGPDFVFENLYDQPILIRAHAGNGSMYVTIYSSDVIKHTPREVPGVSKQLPEEVQAETGVNNKTALE